MVSVQNTVRINSLLNKVNSGYLIHNSIQFGKIQWISIYTDWYPFQYPEHKQWIAFDQNQTPNYNYRVFGTILIDPVAEYDYTGSSRHLSDRMLNLLGFPLQVRISLFGINLYSVSEQINRPMEFFVSTNFYSQCLWFSFVHFFVSGHDYYGIQFHFIPLYIIHTSFVPLYGKFLTTIYRIGIRYRNLNNIILAASRCSVHLTKYFILNLILLFACWVHLYSWSSQPPRSHLGQ